jgi:hypothetical protein
MTPWMWLVHSVGAHGGGWRRSKFSLRTQHPSASRIRTYARRRSVDRCLRASMRRDVRCCHDALVRGGHRAFMDGHTLHHASEGLVTSRCYFWIQCWCNGGLADSATATFDFSCCPRCLDGRLHAAATLHRSTALRDGRDCGCSSLVHWSGCCWQIVTWIVMIFQVTVSLDACIDMRCAATHLCLCPASTRRARHTHTHSMWIEVYGRRFYKLVW